MIDWLQLARILQTDDCTHAACFEKVGFLMKTYNSMFRGNFKHDTVMIVTDAKKLNACLTNAAYHCQ